MTNEQAREREHLITLIDNAPTVEERPQGKWLDIYRSHIAYECSNCHGQMPITDEFKFCPFCGSFNGCPNFAK